MIPKVWQTKQPSVSLFNREVWQTSFSPDRSPFLRRKSQHKSCCLWLWSSSSTNSWGNSLLLQTSVQAINYKTKVSSPPSRWPCTGCRMPWVGRWGLAEWPGPQRRLVWRAYPALRSKTQISTPARVLMACNALDAADRSVCFFIYCCKYRCLKSLWKYNCEHISFLY